MSCSLLQLHVQIITRRGVHVTPEQFDERFRMLRRVTESHDLKQQAALVSNLRRNPTTLKIQSQNLQVRATALKLQLLQQLGIDPEQTQKLITRRPIVLEYQADSLVRKATNQGQLLSVDAGYVVVQLWTRHEQLITVGTQLLDDKLTQLQLLLQPYMPLAAVRQLVLSQPRLAAGHSPEAVQGRLKVLQECLPDWSPEQLGAALLTYATVLERSPEAIRYKWRIAS
jgi:hypothetical protein